MKRRRLLGAAAGAIAAADPEKAPGRDSSFPIWGEQLQALLWAQA